MRNGWSVFVLGPATLLLLAAGNGRSEGSAKASFTDTTGWPATFGFGRKATTTEISRLDIDVRSDGTGLPAGTGNGRRGRIIYEVKCATCHGKNGREGPFVQLVGPMGDSSRAKTIGNY